MNRIKEKLAQVTKNDLFKILVNYTLIFGILAGFLILIFKQYGKSLVWESDGLRMHLVNLRYLRELLINFIRTGHLSTFTWTIGAGMDLFSNWSYYITGDIFSYLAVLVRTKDTTILYSFLVILRMYCVGIAFLCYARYRKMNNTSSVIGALMYTFSSFVLYGLRHPYFINAIILFPLVMIGIEKIIKEEKYVYYTIIIAITFFVNFYFAYPICIVIAIYGVLLAINTYKKEGFKKIIKVLLKTLLYSLIGIMICGVILLPTGVSYLDSERSSGAIFSLYPISYYRNITNSLLTLGDPGYWAVLGTQSLIFITIPLFILKKRKENSPLFMLLIIIFISLLIPKISSMFMGFNFPKNRWSFVFSFIFAFITTTVLNEDYKLSKKELLIIIATILLYLGINIIFEIKLSIYTTIQILLVFAWIIVIGSKDKIQNKFKRFNLYKVCLFMLIILGIGSSIKYLYDVDGNNYVSEFYDNNEIDDLIETNYDTIPDFGKAVNYIKKKDTGFYKISKYPYAYENVSILEHFNSIGHFNSIIPSNFSERNQDLNNSDWYIITGCGEFDYRTKITSLLGVKYLINYDNGIVPYGYTQTEGYKGNSKIYENNYYLPFGVLYNKYITEEEYNRLSSLEKESSLLKATILEDNADTDTLTHFNYDYSNSIKEIEHEVIDKNKIFTDSNNIKIKEEEKNSFEINLNNVENSEIYILFENLQYKPYSKQETIDSKLNKESTLLDVAQAEKKYKWYQPNTAYNVTVEYNDILKKREIKNWSAESYYNITDFLFNLGYYDNASGKIKVTLSKQGYYTFDDIKVYAVSMNDYEEDITNLRKSNFEATEWDNGYLKGKVNAETDGILQFQTMYNDGWKVYVDGKKVDTLKSNKYFLGIEIDSGEHEIYMKYSTPYLKEGLVISIAGLVIFTVLCINNKKRKTPNKSKVNIRIKRTRNKN